MMVVTHDNISASRAPVPQLRSRPSDTVLYLLWGLFSTLMIVVALSDYFRGGGRRWWEPLLTEGSSQLFGTGLLITQRRLGRRYLKYINEPARWFGHHLKWLPLISIMFMLLVFGTRSGVYALLGETYHHESWLVVYPYETIKLSLFVCLWLGAIFCFDSYDHLQEQQRRVLLMQRSLSEARLSQLTSQLRPHFFFNVLNTISALMHVDVARADRLLTRLGDLLRGSLTSTTQDLVSLREEMQLLELYSQIMLERYADRVTVQWKMDESILHAVIPPLLLQPLLENAFKHGVEHTSVPVCVEVIVQREVERLMLIIRNTGSTLPENIREGIGLRNCRERLQLMYGDDATLILRSTMDSVEAFISLPWLEQAA